MSLAGLVLAGGGSTRMGRDKALLELDGTSLLDRARALLHAAGADPVFVAGRPEEPDGLPDAEPGAGPAMAARDALLGLADAGHELALVVPVDMPLMTAETLDALVAAAAAGAAAYEGHPLPLCARLRQHALGEADPRSMRDLLTALSAVALSPEGLDARLFTNVNTPEDWRRLTAR